MRLLLLVLVLLAGCAEAPESGEPVPDAPVDAVQEPFPAPDVRLWWQGQEGHHLLLGRTAWTADDMAHIEAHEEGIEGGDFGIVLEMRGPRTGSFQYDADLQAPGTFRFDYEEAVFWRGEPVCRVLEVSPFSTLDIGIWDPDGAGTAGAFEWRFDGDCPDRGEQRSRHVRGEW